MRKYFRDRRAPWTVSNGRMGFLTLDAPESPLDRSATPAEFGNAIRQHFANDLRQEATGGLAAREPEASAQSLRFGVGNMPLLGLAAFAVSCALAPAAVFTAFAITSALLFISLAAVRVGLAAVAEIPSAGNPRARLADADLPVVTILAPLFREAQILPSLIRSIEQLDYPAAKLDVKILLEESDRATINETHRLGLGLRHDVIIVPPSMPQTKPKACNYGLLCARGDLIVIYDAEDEPESGQLRLAAETFAAADCDLACVQARLNFYNPDENWLTRLFTLEYCLWFDHFLPALDRLGAPVPLGGTSNIFRTDVLAEVGGWDPHNVTEDADLGLRLARCGFRTAVIGSTTFEEANCRIGNWVRQRTRWMKGYIQTWLVHRRDRRFGGWRAALSVDLFIGGTAFAALLNPILWLLLAAQSFSGVSPLAVLPDWLRLLIISALTAGNLALLALAAAAPLKRGLGRLSSAALLVPVYWLMMSFAAWRAVYQLITRPSFWEKTDHGLSAGAKARRAAALRALGLE